MIEPKEKPRVKLVGEDGNAWFIMGRVGHALRRAGADEEYVKKYQKECMAGDYDRLLNVTMEYVNVY